MLLQCFWCRRDSLLFWDFLRYSFVFLLCPPTSQRTGHWRDFFYRLLRNKTRGQISKIKTWGKSHAIGKIPATTHFLLPGSKSSHLLAPLFSGLSSWASSSAPQPCSFCHEGPGSFSSPSGTLQPQNCWASVILLCVLLFPANSHALMIVVMIEVAQKYLWCGLSGKVSWSVTYYSHLSLPGVPKAKQKTDWVERIRRTEQACGEKEMTLAGWNRNSWNCSSHQTLSC